MLARFRPTMQKTAPFLFVVCYSRQSWKVPKGGNCFCAAGASQSCVNIATLIVYSLVHCG